MTKKSNDLATIHTKGSTERTEDVPIVRRSETVWANRTDMAQFSTERRMTKQPVEVNLRDLKGIFMNEMGHQKHQVPLIKS